MNNSLISRFFRYLIRPTYYSESPKNILVKISELARLFALLYTLTILSGLGIYLVIALTGYDLGNNSVVELVQNTSILPVVFLAAVIAPLTEELTFRLFLRFSYIKFSISISFILIFVFNLVSDHYFKSFPDDFLSIRSFLNGIDALGYVLILLFLGIFIYFVTRVLIKRKKAEEFYSKNIGKLFYVSAIVFALVHINNYLNIGGLILLTPILVLPQFFAGIFLGYIRMVYGFKWSIIIHGVYNFVTLSPYIVFSLGSTQLRQIISLTENPAHLVELPESDVLLLSIVVIMAFIALVVFALLNLYSFVDYFLKKPKLPKTEV